MLGWKGGIWGSILNSQGIVREDFCEEVALRKPKEHEGQHVGS